jgi:hypothetical protein
MAETIEKAMLQEAVARVAAEIGVEAEALLAVTEVESGGHLFAQVAGRAEPLIRFEGHFFYRLLRARKRNLAVVSGLASPVAGAIRNPRSQGGRWKLLRRACAIDRDAGLSSTSWGVGQVMGAHWRWLGYESVVALVAEARSGMEGQVRLFARYIDKAELAGRLRSHDWSGFARAYNGPDFARLGYHRKMKAAYRRLAGINGLPERNGRALLSLGARGAAVEALQRDLRRLGYALIADGDFGPATNAALADFQSATGIEPDGLFGPETMEAIARRLPKGNPG